MTSSSPPSQTRWPTGFRIRPDVDPQSDDVEVTDTVTGRRFRWSAPALASYILGYARPANGADGGYAAWHEALDTARGQTGLVPGWRHWAQRHWYPSDQYYVASRRWDYADISDGDGSIRTTALRQYLEKDGPPVEVEERSGRRIALGQPASPDKQAISQLLVKRRSGRAYVPKPVPLERLSGLLWYGLAEIRQRRDLTRLDEPLSYLDSYGSAWDIYLCVYGVAGLDPGVYRYDPGAHDLTSIRPGDHRAAMIDVLQGMRSPATAAWTLGLVADFPRYQWRYRHEHGLRRLYLEAGVLGQELIILGMSYGLSTLVTPAQRDRPYMALHDLPEDRFAPLYTLTMGWSRGAVGVLFEDQEGAAPEADAR